MEYGEEQQARRIARGIGKARAEKPIETTGELARLIEDVKPPAWTRRPREGKKPLHPATQVFQALRIEVNQELEQLERPARPGHPPARRGRPPGGDLATTASKTGWSSTPCATSPRARSSRSPAGRAPRPRCSRCSPGGRSAPATRKWPAIRGPARRGCGLPAGCEGGTGSRREKPVRRPPSGREPVPGQGTGSRGFWSSFSRSPAPCC